MQHNDVSETCDLWSYGAISYELLEIKVRKENLKISFYFKLIWCFYFKEIFKNILI